MTTDHQNVQIRWGDGFLAVEPTFPEKLIKKLKYWHRELAWDEAAMKRVASGHYRELYTVNTHIDDENRLHQQLCTMPGFAHLVMELLRKEGYEFEFIDQRTPPPPMDIVRACVGLYDYQMPCAITALQSGGGVIACPTGWGKCMCPDTNVLYMNGSVNRMGNIAVGDVLMGDDSQPRTVLERIDGSGPMYRITPKNGESFEVADNHILSLVKSGDCKRDKYPDGRIVDITVTDYLQQSLTFKHRYKLYKVCVDWPNVSVNVDPYWLGLWIGDGDSIRPYITTDDNEVVVAIYAYANTLGLRVTNTGIRDTRRTPTYGIVKSNGQINTLLNAMRAYGLLKSRRKFIPQEFKANSRTIRLQLLAGLMDSGGSLNEGTDFDFVNTNSELVDDVAFLARSLGFRVHQTTRKCKGFGVEIDAYRLRITGDTHLIPTRIPHKQAAIRQQKKHPLRTSFSIERIDDGPYVGVKLDGNHRYLLGDFTVTHNTHIIAALCKAFTHEELCARNTPLTVVTTPDKDITAKDYRDLVKLLPDRDIGLVMSGKKGYSDDVQVITLDSLHNLNLDEVGVLIVDEVHTAASAKRTELLLQARKALRWGVSATPSGRFDGRDIVTEGLFGPVVYTRTYAQGVTDGALVPIKVLWFEAPQPHMGLERYNKYKTRSGRYRNAVWKNENYLKLIGDVLKRIPGKHQTLCIMQYLEQMNLLAAHCDGIHMVHAETSQDNLSKKEYRNLAAISAKERKGIYTDMESGKIRQILSTHVYKQGVNFPDLQVVINVGGGGSDIVAKQVPGRESRKTADKQVSYLIDFWHPWDKQTGKDGKIRAGYVAKDDQSREKAYTELEFEQVWMKSIDDLPFIEASP